MPEKSRRKVWVAVKVWHGMVGEIRAFRDPEAASRQEKLWRRRMNPDYDDTGVAEVLVKA